MFALIQLFAVLFRLSEIWHLQEDDPWQEGELNEP